jgi:Autotransporter beta-domain
MRKLIAITIIIFICTLSSSAQITKGSIFLGGDFIFTSSNSGQTSSNSIKSRNFGISPAIGLVVQNNLLAGVKLNYYHASSKDNSGNRQEINSWGGGLFLRKFKRIRESDFYFFIQGDLSTAFGDEIIGENSANQVKVNSNSYSLDIYPGVNYRLSKKLLLETGLNSFFRVGYSHYKRVSGTTIPLTETYNNFGINSSFSGVTGFYIGVKILLEKQPPLIRK